MLFSSWWPDLISKLNFAERWSAGGFNPFTPKSDRYQISPAASPEMLHLFFFHCQLLRYKRWPLYYQFSLPFLLGEVYFFLTWEWQGFKICFTKGRELWVVSDLYSVNQLMEIVTRSQCMRQEAVVTSPKRWSLWSWVDHSSGIPGQNKRKGENEQKLVVSVLVVLHDSHSFGHTSDYASRACWRELA